MGVQATVAHQPAQEGEGEFYFFQKSPNITHCRTKVAPAKSSDLPEYLLRSHPSHFLSSCSSFWPCLRLLFISPVFLFLSPVLDSKLFTFTCVFFHCHNYIDTSAKNSIYLLLHPSRYICLRLPFTNCPLSLSLQFQGRRLCSVSTSGPTRSHHSATVHVVLRALCAVQWTWCVSTLCVVVSPICVLDVRTARAPPLGLCGLRPSDGTCVCVFVCMYRPQVVHEAYSRFTEESLTQSVCEKPTDSTEVTIKVSGDVCQIRCREN